MEEILQDILRSTRRKLLLDIRDVEKSSGVSFSVISRLENGASRPTVVSVFNLASALNIPPDIIGLSLGLKGLFHPYHAEVDDKFPTPAINIHDIESFLTIYSREPEKATELLRSIYKKIVLIQHPNPFDELAVSGLADEMIKTATLPVAGNYVPLPYADTLLLEYLEHVYECGGVLTFFDLGYYIRGKRTLKYMSLKQLADDTHVSTNALSRLERGVVDRIFLDEIIAIDNALGQQGKIFGMCWAAGEFHSGIIRNKVRGMESTPPFKWTDEEYALATTIITIDRMYASWYTSWPPTYINEFREQNNILLEQK